MYYTIKQLEKKMESLRMMHTPTKTKIDNEAIEISDWVEAKINEVKKEGFTGCYSSNILPTHLSTKSNLEAIERGYLDEGL